MEQIGNEIKKMIQAGLGAVATGVEKTQEANDTLAEKGEPLYEQAKAAVCDAAGKIRKAVDESGIGDLFTCPDRVDQVIEKMQEMTQRELDQVRTALEDLYPTRPSGREESPEEGTEEEEDETNPLSENEE